MIHLPLFTSARIKLTLTYILIFLGISGVISGLFYYRTSQIIEAEYERLNRRIQLEINGQIFPAPQMIVRRIQAEDLEAAKKQIVIQLLYINGLIAIIVAGSGYILSGRTLAPIQRVLENQKQFVADAAHELRTPITALKTSLEVNLMDKQLNKKATKILKENLEDVTNLESITNNLLKLSKLNHQPLEIEPVAIASVVEKSLKHIQPLAKQKKIGIKYEKNKSDIIVAGNESALVDLVNIFLDNAIKYSLPHTQTTLSTATSRPQCILTITDQGIGIAKEQIEHIFDRFYRADTARSKENNLGGYGLGLSIAKRIIDEHHGSIKVKSQPGRGTTFIVTLPLA